MESKVEKELYKELSRSFGIESVFLIGNTTVLIMCVGEAFKLVKGTLKGLKEDLSKLKKLAEHHHIGLELWEYDFYGNTEYHINKQTIYKEI